MASTNSVTIKDTLDTYNYIPSEFFKQGYVLPDDGQAGFTIGQR